MYLRIQMRVCKEFDPTVVCYTYLQGVPVHKDKFKIRITVGLSYIRKHSWWLACSPIFSIWVSSKKFQKSDIGWPRQPPTENMLRFNMIFFMIPPNTFFSKHQNKAEFKSLDDSKVLSSDFPDLRTSAASMSSTASTASMASMYIHNLFFSLQLQNVLY